MKKIILSAISVLFISGCASFHNDYYVDSKPTLESVQHSKYQKQVYKGDLYVVNDFKEDGTLKSLADYDFSKESAPCNVISGYEKAYSGELNFQKIKVNNKGVTEEFLFHCRESDRSMMEDQRLYLVNSAIECKTRNWNYSASMTYFYNSLAGQCSAASNSRTMAKWNNAFN